MDKDISRILKQAEEQGFRVVTSTSSHARIFTADGQFVTGVASSPGEYRGWRNMLARLKRHNFVLSA